MDIKNFLKYDSESGIFTWKERHINLFLHCKNPERACNSWNSQFSKTIAGAINGKGYIDIKVFGKKYKAHRLAWLYVYGKFPNGEIDHDDHDKTNNSIRNLKDVSHCVNGKNKSLHKNSSSNICGVTWNNTNQNWRVRITVNGKRIDGGSFDNIDDAISKRKDMDTEYNFHINHGI